jgi:glycolate oxidase
VSLETALAAVLPAHALLTEAEAKRPYECDGLSAYRQIPRVVAIPETREQVRQIVRLCNEHDVPVVPRGAGTGLSGGALPPVDGCLLSLARFNRIIDIDPVNRFAVVESGVRNLAISEAAAPHGLYYAPDPSSQIACTIGGNVAENSGGVHCLKYGLTVHNVLELHVLTSDGEWLTVGGKALDAPGYDLLALMHGSEGLLGIVMEITVKLLPLPEVAKVLLAPFPSVDAAGRAVAHVIGAGIIPAGLEMMDRLAIQAAEDYCKAGYPTDAAAILLCELDGTGGEVEAQIERVERLFRDAGATDVRISRDERERQRFWQGRKAAFPAMGRVAPDYYCMDGTIPRAQLARVLTEISEMSDRFGLPVANVFHAGDGNLHPLIAYDANDDEQLRTTELFGGKILELCVAVGGTVTGEHGVGVEKLDQMCVQFTPAELERFHEVKRSFDPGGRLNPGKAVPTPRHCREFTTLGEGVGSQESGFRDKK